MIPFEKFSQSNSLAYFKYEEKLHLYDPVISNMVSERYRCAIYSDHEDEEDESDCAYESDEEEFSDPNKMEYDSVSETVENCFSFYQDSDTVCVDPKTTIKPEVKDEEKFQKIESKLFDSNSEIDFQFFQKILLATLDSVCTSHAEFLFASNLLRHFRLEFGNLPSPTAVSSSETIVFAKPSRFSLFSFDPGGASKDTGHIVRCSELVLDPPSTSVCFLVSFLLSTDLIVESLFADLIFAKLPKHRIHVFDPGGSHVTVDFVAVQHLLHVAMKEEDALFFADLISPKIIEDPILVFDPGGSGAVDNSAVVMFAFSVFSFDV